MWVLLPENASDAFRSLDVSGASSMALDEAYAYSAVLDAPAASAPPSTYAYT
jgi:hypothetical protein